MSQLCHPDYAWSQQILKGSRLIYDPQPWWPIISDLSHKTIPLNSLHCRSEFSYSMAYRSTRWNTSPHKAFIFMSERASSCKEPEGALFSISLALSLILLTSVCCSFTSFFKAYEQMNKLSTFCHSSQSFCEHCSQQPPNHTRQSLDSWPMLSTSIQSCASICTTKTQQHCLKYLELKT